MKPLKTNLYTLLWLAASVAAYANDTIHVSFPPTEPQKGWTFSVIIYDNVLYDSVFTITENGNYTITGTSTVNRVVVAKNVEATITLHNANIHSVIASPFVLASDSARGAQVTLKLVGNNELVTTDILSAGLTVENNAKAVIEGYGSLFAQGGGINIGTGDGYANGGAGIGGGDGKQAGAIVINAGTVTAVGGNYAAGIGGGARQGGGSLTVNGGTIVAVTSGDTNEAAAIGGGGGGGGGTSAGTVNITGGTVYASGGSGLGIGAGAGGTDGVIHITGGTVIADAIGTGNTNAKTQTHISGQNTIVLSPSINATISGLNVLTGNQVYVSSHITAGDEYVDVTLKAALTIPADAVLTIPPGIIFDANLYALTNNGTIRNYGTIRNVGNLTGYLPNAIHPGWIQDISSLYTYTGDSIRPAVTVIDDKVLIPGTDYTVQYADNANAGTATVTVTGKDFYNSKASKQFTINPKPIAGDWAIQGIPATYTFSGDSIKPAPVVTDKNGSTTFELNKDYTVSYSDNLDAGRATVTVTGNNNYSGSVSETFTIEKKLFSNAITVALERETYEYTGAPVKPAVTVKDGYRTMELNKDYIVSYNDNLHIGKATLTVAGNLNYKGSVSKTFTIEAKPFSSEITVALEKETYEYTGDSIKPEILAVYDGKNLLIAGTDYTFAYFNCINAGTSSFIRLTGMGNYTHYVNKVFTISPAKTNFSIDDIPDQVYTGYGITLDSITVRYQGNVLTQNKDYVIFSYRNNVYPGTATVSITGKGNYSGTATKEFNIVRHIPDNGIQLFSEDWTYSGDFIEPDITIVDEGKVLEVGKDYTFSYSNNLNAGTATVIIEGIGTYSGKVTKDFVIKPKSITAANVSGITDYAFTGDSIKQVITVTDGNKALSEDDDYLITYSNNIQIGTATMVIVGKANYSGSITKYFDILERKETYLITVVFDDLVKQLASPAIDEGTYAVESNEEFLIAIRLYSSEYEPVIYINGIKEPFTKSSAIDYEFKLVPVKNVVVEVNLKSLTDTERTTEPDVHIAGVSDGVFISGLFLDEVYTVFDLSGRLVYQGKASVPEEFVPLREKGIYLLKHRNKTCKFLF
ncbi:MAG: Ig-like domain-containing protein [Bacteroidales bacterium]